MPSIRINDIVGILAWRDADTLDDIKKIYRQTKKGKKKVKKIYRAKYRNELDDDLEEHVEKKFKPVVTFFITSHQLGAQKGGGGGRALRKATYKANI